MTDREILKAIYRVLPWDKLYEELPEVQRDDVDALFARLTRMLPDQEDSPAEPAPATPEELEGATLLIHTDGACSGNPGPAGIGVVVRLEDGTELLSWGESIGKTTNNVAEYRAMIAGLEKALELGAGAVQLRADSQLVVRQVNGRYKVKNARMKKLHTRVMDLLGQIDEWKAVYVPREQNAEADALASAAVKKAKKRKAK
jgi:ribonuclease HI